MEEEKFVKVPYNKFISMFEDADSFNKLDCMGVDNWCGYDEVEWDEEATTEAAETYANDNLIK